MNIPGLNEERLPVINQAVRELAAGASNSLGEITLSAGTTTTLVTDNRATPDSHVSLCPLTVNAAAAIPTTYVSSRTQGAFTLSHSNAGTVDRTFSYRISRT